MMRATEQGRKQESIREIELSLRLLCKIQRAQTKTKKTKNQWALEKCYSFVVVVLGKKFWCTAMADSPKSASIEKML